MRRSINISFARYHIEKLLTIMKVCKALRELWEYLCRELSTTWGGFYAYVGRHKRMLWFCVSLMKGCIVSAGSSEIRHKLQVAINRLI